MTEAEAHAIIMSFPAVTEGVAWGYPAYKAADKFFTRLRREDDSLVLLEVGFDEREMLMEAGPETFHLTEHYRKYKTVLARLATLDPGTLRGMLERRWRAVVPKRMIKAYDAALARGCAEPGSMKS